MRLIPGIAAIIALLAAGAGFAGYSLSRDPALHAAAAKGDTMEWLRADFHLTGAQLAEVRRLHDSYAGSCQEHCRMIQEMTHARDELREAHGDKAALDAANARLEKMRAACEGAIAEHVRRVAAHMSPEDGRRYLALVVPRIANFDHAGAPDLRLNRPN